MPAVDIPSIGLYRLIAEFTQYLTVRIILNDCKEGLKEDFDSLSSNEEAQFYIIMLTHLSNLNSSVVKPVIVLVIW